LLGLLALRDNSAYIVDRLRHPSFDRRFVTAQLDRTARDGASATRGSAAPDSDSTADADALYAS
jgi:hypothetical protein